MRDVPLFARVLYGAIVVMTALGPLSQQSAEYAARHGMSAAPVVAMLSGIVAGGVSVLAGYRARIGAAALILLFVPAIVTTDAFWGAQDPIAALLLLPMLSKNVLLLGGALMIACLGAGPLSMDALSSERPAPLRAAAAHP
jgi:putative oxidoreductase